MSTALSSILAKIKSRQALVAPVAAAAPTTMPSAPRSFALPTSLPLPGGGGGSGGASVGIDIILFRGSPTESLGINVDPNLVVTSVAPASLASRFNVPLRHRIVMTNGQLISSLDDFKRVMGSSGKEIRLRMVPMTFHNELDIACLESLVARTVAMDPTLDMEGLRADTRYEFLNESSTHHAVFQQRLETATNAQRALDALVVSLANSAPGSHAVQISDELFNEALAFLDTYDVPVVVPTYEGIAGNRPVWEESVGGAEVAMSPRREEVKPAAGPAPSSLFESTADVKPNLLVLPTVPVFGVGPPSSALVVPNVTAPLATMSSSSSDSDEEEAKPKKHKEHKKGKREKEKKKKSKKDKSKKEKKRERERERESSPAEKKKDSTDMNDVEYRAWWGTLSLSEQQDHWDKHDRKQKDKERAAKKR